LYEDTDDTLKDELKVARTSGITAFYEAVNNAKEYYATFPNAVAGANDDTTVQIDVNFSGEEVFGKYLDLNPLHLQFSNVIRKVNIEQDYVQYLERFNKFFYLPDAVRNSRHYAEYLDSLWAYLADFFRRTNSLTDWAKIEEDIRAGFAGANSGAVVSGNGARSAVAAPQPLRLGIFNAVEELEALGMDRLKEALEALGLKCGGTLRDRAARLWSVRGKKPEDFPAGLRAKDSADAKRKKAEGDSASVEPTSVSCA
jgi:splicing factor 3A subunit 3